MTEIRVLHAPDSVSFACQIAAALAANGYSVIRTEGGDTTSRAGDATVVIWSRGMLAAGRAIEAARAALAGRRLIPVAIGKIEPPASFAHLAPIDLSGWSGGREDARWRFVLEEVALALKTPTNAELYCDTQEETPAAETAYIVPMRTIAAGAAGLAALAVAAIVAAALSGAGDLNRVSPEIAADAPADAGDVALAVPPQGPPPQAPAEAEAQPPVLRDAPIESAALPELEEPPQDAVPMTPPGQEADTAESIEPAGPTPLPELATLALPPPPADDFLGVVFRDCADCPDMAEIPAAAVGAATARLASATAAPDPPAAGFAVSRREVTFAEWDACVAAGGCRGYSPGDAGFGRGARPVINVSYEDAMAYAAWLSAKTGRRYRLPREAEWERAAAAEGGSTANANFAGALRSAAAASVSVRMSLPSGSFPANAYGLYDVRGNVWEWVEDCSTSACNERVVKGGAYDSDPSELAPENRAARPEETRDPTVGFRVARDLD